MPLLRIVGWVLLRSARNPAAWLWASLTALGWVAVRAFHPFLITVAVDAHSQGLFYEVAFISGLAGAALALLPLSEASWFLGRLGPPMRLQARAAGILSGALLGLCVALWFPLLTGMLRPSHLVAMIPAFIAGSIHLALLGMLLLHAPLAAGPRALCLPLLAWLLPAALTGQGLLASALRALGDASRHFAPLEDAAMDRPLARLSTLVALAGAVLLLELAPSSSPSRGLESPRSTV